MNLPTLNESFEVATTTNPCRLCAPLGAALAIRGIENAMPVLHGSQGCATYMRRYLVSHFREPMDIASSSFGEQAAVFGGAANLEQALDNVTARYQPSLLGVATTCLAETIGDDVRGIIRQWEKTRGSAAPRIFHVCTPAYSAGHSEGYAATVLALIDQLAEGGERLGHVNLFTPMFASPADIRALRGIITSFALRSVVIPDFSETLDGGNWQTYQSIPEGGTPVADIVAAGRARASLSFVSSEVQAPVAARLVTPGRLLSERFSVNDVTMPAPVGLQGTDRLMSELSELSGLPIPASEKAERGRLLDAMVDAHKLMFERRVALVGDSDLVISLAAFCGELGLSPVLCASGSSGKQLSLQLEARGITGCTVLEDTDHRRVELAAQDLKLDLVIGPSKVRPWARRLGIPVLNLGFPIHDRFGAARLRTVGYDGALHILDRVANALLEHRQEQAGRDWSYL